jgi:hypothetical protein
MKNIILVNLSGSASHVPLIQLSWWSMSIKTQKERILDQTRQPAETGCSRASFPSRKWGASILGVGGRVLSSEC